MASDVLDELKTDKERVSGLVNMLIARSTGGAASDSDYRILRSYFVGNSELAHLLPAFVRANRELGHFWHWIKEQAPTWADRRTIILKAFTPLQDHVEQPESMPHHSAIVDALQSYTDSEVQRIWTKAVDRLNGDPDGAVTAARSLIESVCKHILDSLLVDYPDRADLNELYSNVTKHLNLSPSQHTDPIVRQILGGCISAVVGLGSLRNKVGDAHGKGRNGVRLRDRHARLVVNLSGTLALFLIQTYSDRSQS